MLLPPILLGSTLDVRFSNGGALATVEPSGEIGGDGPFHDVKLHGVEYPLTFHLRGGWAQETFLCGKAGAGVRRSRS